MIKNYGAVKVMWVRGGVCLDVYNGAVIRQISGNIIMFDETWDSAKSVLVRFVLLTFCCQVLVIW